MPRLFLPALAIGLAIATHPSHAATALPHYDVANNCKAKMSAATAIGVSQDGCVADEQHSRQQLASNWTKFSPADRKSCVGETAIAGTPSYVELQTCLEMAQWAGQK